MGLIFRCDNCFSEEPAYTWDDLSKECLGCGQECCADCIDSHQTNCSLYQDEYGVSEDDDDGAELS